MSKCLKLKYVEGFDVRMFSSIQPQGEGWIENELIVCDDYDVAS